MELICPNFNNGCIGKDVIAFVTSPQNLQMITFLAIIVILVSVELIQTRLTTKANEALRVVYMLQFLERKGNRFACNDLHASSTMPFKIFVPNHLQILEQNVLDFLNFLRQYHESRRDVEVCGFLTCSKTLRTHSTFHRKESIPFNDKSIRSYFEPVRHLHASQTFYPSYKNRYV
jgi:hypothetical protein